MVALATLVVSVVNLSCVYFNWKGKYDGEELNEYFLPFSLFDVRRRFGWKNFLVVFYVYGPLVRYLMTDSWTLIVNTDDTHVSDFGPILF